MADFLFAYGTLGPAEGDADGWHADAVRGCLYDLGPYPALVALDDPAAGWVEGHVRPVSESELIERLDPYEGVGQGLYRRDRAVTREGRLAWVYVYLPPLPQYVYRRGPLTRWSGPRGLRP